MEFKETDYVLGVWFACNKKGNDWMMTVIKRDNEWIGEYRFRYRRDEKIFNSNDIKRVYGFKIDGTTPEEEIIEKMNQMLEVIKIEYPEGEYISIKGNMEKFVFIVAQQPWAHLQTLSKEDYENIKKEKSNDK